MDERDAFEPVRSRTGQQPPAAAYTPGPTPEPAYYPPQPPTRTRGTFGLPLLIGSSLAALAVGVAVGWAAFHKTDAKPAATPAAAAPGATPAAATITVSGHLTLQRGFLFQDASSTTCSANPNDGFTDISEGVAVTIGDQTGQTLAVTQLEAGLLVSGNLAGHACQFGFSAQVPGGKTLYTVLISHRGTQTFTHAQAMSQVEITLG